MLNFHMTVPRDAGQQLHPTTQRGENAAFMSRKTFGRWQARTSVPMKKVHDTMRTGTGTRAREWRRTTPPRSNN